MIDKTKKHLRFDDICLNTKMSEANSMAYYAIQRGWNVIYCISPLVHDCSREKDTQRVFPSIYKAYSDYREFFKVDTCGKPTCLPWDVAIASHGLIHVDHRLLAPECQELSIVTSCSLLKTKIFVPPFNKYDLHTRLICEEHGIELIRFEDGWLSLEHNTYDPNHTLYYLHSRAFTVDVFKAWLNDSDNSPA